MSRFEELKGFVAGVEDDMTKFYEKGNKAAGTRARNRAPEPPQALAGSSS